MFIAVSRILVMFFGIALCAFAVWGMATPRRAMQWVKYVLDQEWGIYAAVVSRLVLGAALIIVAPESVLPLVFLVIGWFAIVAAMAAGFMGRQALRRFAAWFIDRFTQTSTRLWLLVAAAFGVFLIYGVY